MGAKTLQLLFNVTSSDGPKTKWAIELKDLFRNHLHPSPSIIAEQILFLCITQNENENENIADFVTNLKKLSKKLFTSVKLLQL